jgi:cytochrome c biogenesis factor
VAAGTVGGVVLLQTVPSGSLTVRLFLVAASSAAGAALVTARPHTAAGGVRRLGVAAAHSGFAVVMIAAAGSSLGTDTSVLVRIGEAAEVDGETVRLVSLDSGRRDGFDYVRADVRLGRGDDASRFRPELRAYEEQRTPTAEASFRGGLLDETVVVMSALDADARGARFEVLRRPLLPAVWWGALLMLAGGVAAGVGAPRSGRRTAPGAARWRSATAARRSAGAIDADAMSTTRRASRRDRAPAPP